MLFLSFLIVVLYLTSERCSTGIVWLRGKPPTQGRPYRREKRQRELNQMYEQMSRRCEQQAEKRRGQIEGELNRRSGALRQPQSQDSFGRFRT